MDAYFGDLRAVCFEKWEQLDRALAAAGIEVIVANDLPSVRYLTGYLPYLTLSPPQGQIAVYFRGRGRPLLYVPRYYANFARVRFPWLEVRELPHGIPAVAAELARILKASGLTGTQLGCIGLTAELDRALRHGCPDNGITEVGMLLARVRAVKTPGEIALLRDAVRIAEAGMNAAMSSLAAGKSECDVAADAEHCMRRLGTESHAIVLRGRNAAILQEVSTEDVFTSEDLALVDLGCYRRGYRAEYARTVAIRRPARGRHRRLVEVVSRALDEAASLLVPGGSCGVVARRAAEVLHDAGYAEYMHPYPVGHGLGVSGSEHPLLTPASDVALEEHMVINLEPGIFIPSEDIGIRIEDVWLVRHDGPERLTTSVPHLG